MKRRDFIGAAAAMLAAPAVSAQAMPSAPIRIVVGFPPGGGTDAVARLLAQKLGALWNTSVIVENRPGAAGVIAAEYTTKQPADGTTLLMANFSSHAVAPGLYPDLAYNVKRDFAPIVLVGVTPTVLIGNRKHDVKTLQDVVALCKKQSGQITFGSAGLGSVQHLALEMFKLRAGVDAVHVPYKGSGPMMTDLLGGHIDFSFETVPSAIQQIRHGAVVAIAQTNAARSRLLPDVPTVAESGFPGFQATTWYGLVGPARLPKALAERMNRDVDTVLAMPDVAKAMDGYSAEGGGGSVEKFAQFMADEETKWGKVIKEAKVTAT
ncbi:tripartite tricarboxylate transporter substrate binding protein [Bordetella flabilis]|uniref:LacI family transcriptional regulator n=1 Tax=Bordetella flabilis TaxID=463014 RepID=A0A193G9E8_9BORD|nr:tripartite tricarboxylate transporter substrate binding protein [Bordetella flabilis]ANN75889.1 LacI family transcriptional regulator [Bordetella flabilis]